MFTMTIEEIMEDEHHPSINLWWGKETYKIWLNRSHWMSRVTDLHAAR